MKGAIIERTCRRSCVPLALATPSLLQFVKLCAMTGKPLETAIGVAYVQSWMLNEIMAWVGSSSFGSDQILHGTRVEHLVHTSITILKAPGQRRRVYRRLAFCGLTVHAYFAPSWYIFRLYLQPIYWSQLREVLERFLRSMDDNITEGFGRAMVTAGARFSYYVFLSTVPVISLLALIFLSFRVVRHCRDANPSCGSNSLLAYAFMGSFLLIVLSIFLPIFPIIIIFFVWLIFCILYFGTIYIGIPFLLIYLYYALVDMVVSRCFNPRPFRGMITSDRIFVFHTIINSVVYYFCFYSAEGTSKPSWMD
jgi:hypothetical protein